MSIPEANYDIGKTLLKLRILKGYSQKYVADCLDMSKATYQRCEKACTDVSLTVIIRAADLYCMSIDGFIHYSVKNNSAIPPVPTIQEPVSTTEILMNMVSQLNKNGVEMNDICKLLSVFKEILIKKQ